MINEKLLKMTIDYYYRNIDLLEENNRLNKRIKELTTENDKLSIRAKNLVEEVNELSSEYEYVDKDTL